MREPLLAYRATPEPRRVVALGDCTLGRDILAGASKIVGPIGSLLTVDLRISTAAVPSAITQALTELHDADARPSGHAH